MVDQQPEACSQFLLSAVLPAAKELPNIWPVGIITQLTGVTVEHTLCSDCSAPWVVSGPWLRTSVQLASLYPKVMVGLERKTQVSQGYIKDNCGVQ